MENKTFKGIKSKQEAVNKIEALTKAIQEYKKLSQTPEIKRQIENWNWTIDECKHAIAFFERGELQCQN
jgi:hypothetical protein